MKKLLLYCRKTFENDGELFAEFGKEYTGIVSEDGQRITVEGERHQVMVYDGEAEDGSPIAFHFNSQFKNHFYQLRQLEPMIAIETEVWVPAPDMPGGLILKGRRTISEVLADMKQALKEQDLWDELVTIINSWDIDPDEPFPSRGYLAIYPVKGGSEGYYVHIEVVGSRLRTFLYLGKTLSEDIEVALKITNALVRLFH